MNKLLALLFVTILLLSPQWLFADDPCERDRAKFCALSHPDDPARLYCLKSVEVQLSGGCKSYIRNIKGTTQDFIDECEADYHRLCTQTPAGKGRILECLRSHSKELDFECRKRVNDMPRHSDR